MIHNPSQVGFRDALAVAALAANNQHEAVVDAINHRTPTQLAHLAHGSAYAVALLAGQLTEQHDLPGEQADILANVAHALRDQDDA